MQVVEHVTPDSLARPRRRRRVPWSFVIAGVAIGAAVLYLVLANTGTTAEYYMTIKELRVCTSCSTRAVRVAGVVAPGSIVRNEKPLAVHFTMTDSAQSMPVVYGGVVPDIFQPGVQVVVEGHLDSTGVFQASNLLTKCPSKFQSATPAAGNSGSSSTTGASGS